MRESRIKRRKRKRETGEKRGKDKGKNIMNGEKGKKEKE